MTAISTTSTGTGTSSIPDPRYNKLMVDGDLEKMWTEKMINEKARIDMEVMAAMKQAQPTAPNTCRMDISQAVNGGFTLIFRGKLYIAKTAEELSQVIVGALVAERMTGSK